MKNCLIILLLLTSALHADKKPKRNVSVVDTPPSTGIKTDVGGHLLVESSGIKTIFAEYWPPPITQTDNEANLLIVKAFGLLVSYGQIKLKKPLLTPEQRAERARRLLESGSGFIASNNSPDRTSGKAEVEASDERK